MSSQIFAQWRSDFVRASKTAAPDEYIPVHIFLDRAPSRDGTTQGILFINCVETGHSLAIPGEEVRKLARHAMTVSDRWDGELQLRGEFMQGQIPKSDPIADIEALAEESGLHTLGLQYLLHGDYIAVREELAGYLDELDEDMEAAE